MSQDYAPRESVRWKIVLNENDNGTGSLSVLVFKALESDSIGNLRVFNHLHKRMAEVKHKINIIDDQLLVFCLCEWEGTRENKGGLKL